MGRFETEWLARPENLAMLADLPGQCIDTVHRRRPPKTIVLDIDSSKSPIYGAQEGSGYNGHFGCTCYHPLFVFNQLGDLEPCSLRSGNVHSAAAWRDVLEPVVVRYRDTVVFAATRPLPTRRSMSSSKPRATAMRSGCQLSCRFGYLLKRPVDRPPHAARRLFANFNNEAQSWNKPRHVVAKVEWGELYPRFGFIVTNLARSAERVVAFYNRGSTCEQYMKEGKKAIKWTRLSCRSFAANAARLQLYALAYNLGNFMRTLAMPRTAEPWSLTSLREKLIKIGAKVVSHGRSITFQMAEVAVPREMFADILSLIAGLRAPPAPA
jgi:hypothetical protein